MNPQTIDKDFAWATTYLMLVVDFIELVCICITIGYVLERQYTRKSFNYSGKIAA